MCFFREVTTAHGEGQPVVVSVPSENGPFPIFELTAATGPVWVFHPPVGAAMSAAGLELLVASGVDRVIACGGAGNLEGGRALGHVVVPTAAVRDEGASFHYLPPSRTVDASPAGVAAVIAASESAGVPFRDRADVDDGRAVPGDPGQGRGPPRRGLPHRRDGGRRPVRAVAQSRGVTIGQLLYAADDLSGDEWDHHGWDKDRTGRERLFDLALDAVQRL